jgi:hypothetical protein
MLRAGEELEADGPFERVDMTPDGGLREPKRPRGARKGAFLQDGQERAVKLPARVRIIHTF